MDLAQAWNDILANPLPALAVIGNLIIIESLLSVDNAAVLATMVMDLPKEQRSRALRYGIIGAYVFRGICLLLAGWLIQFWYLEVIGGAYLLFLVFKYFKGKMTPKEDDDVLEKNTHWLYKATIGWMGQFWATVALVELMDLAFSIDNVFAAVAYSKNLILVWTGVFIGILAMRFVAQGFVRLMERYKFLETAAFIVIFILGAKLMLAMVKHYAPDSAFTEFLKSPEADWGTSILTVSIFFVPVMTSMLFNFPRRSKPEEAEQTKVE